MPLVRRQLGLRKNRAPRCRRQCVERDLSGEAALERRAVGIVTLEVVRIDSTNNLLLIKGSVPGATGGDVIVYPAVRAGVSEA